MNSNETDDASESPKKPVTDPVRSYRKQLKPWSSMAYRDYSLLWLSGIGMVIAMQLRLFASSQWLYDDTESAVALGLLGAIQMLQMPIVVYGGLLADIFNRKILMVFTQGISFLSLLLL
ncbi:MAG: hypothetical protein O3B95_13075, partial [Chloroflexi bacterium]|nr:hypothetical protein [Chloroflexota bacterium]